MTYSVGTVQHSPAGPESATDSRRRRAHPAFQHPVCVRLLMSRFRPGARDMGRSLLYLAGGVALICAVLALLVQLPQSPYNLRELFAGRPLWLSLPLFALAVVWGGGIPNVLARVTIICPGLQLLQPVLLLVMAAPAWWLLKTAVSPESLQDLVGNPVLGWPGEWEQSLRFLALATPFLLFLLYWNLLLEGAGWVGRRFGLCQMLAALLLGLPLLWLSKYLVVDLAATDNILALSAQGPSWQVGGALLLVMALVTLNGALLAWIWLWRTRYQLLVLLLTPVTLIASWWLLNLGLNHQAVVFLLGPNEHFQGGQPALFLRWSLVFLITVAAIAFAHLIPFRLRGTPGIQRQALNSGTLHQIRHGGTVLPPEGIGAQA